VNANRDILERLVRAGVGYYITGGEALAVWAEPRQTLDIDIVTDLAADRYEAVIRPAFEDAYLVNDLVGSGDHAFGWVIHRTEIVRADLVMRRTDPWGMTAFTRRRLIDDPVLGSAWFISPEDLVLAKLAWSDGGASERQMRDSASIVRLQPDLDWMYVGVLPASWASCISWSGSVAIDQAQARLDERLIEAGVLGRRAVLARLRAEAIARVWAAADRAGPMTELERARFLLRRLYPDLEGPRLESIMERLGAEWQAGTWTGFRRPDPPDV